MARQRKKNKPGDLNLLPVMALFSIIIPFLISVASFQKLGIVEVNLPLRSEMNPNQPQEEPDEQAINLSVILAEEGDFVVIGARGGFLPNLYYKEMHTYRCNSDNDTITYDPVALANKNETPKCRDGSEATSYEIEHIHLWLLQKESEEDPGTLVTALYNGNDSVYVDGNNNFVSDRANFKVGDVFATLKESSNRKITPQMYNEAQVKPLSVYDVLAKELSGIHNRFIDAPDADNINIAASDSTAFDKVIKVMDRSRDAGFWKIALGKLAGE